MAIFRSRAKGQAIMLDSAYSSLICLSIVAICVLAISSAARGSNEMAKEAVLEARAISLADYLVKEKISVKYPSAYGEVSKIHEIDSAKFFALDENELAAMIDASSVCVAIDESCSGVCVQRAVVFENEVKYLVVCAS